MAKRIMVVNDTKEILELFHAILTDESYEVCLYAYGISDLEEVLKVKPDLLILDYVIGKEESGWQLLQKLKMKRETATIPIIICTTLTKMTQEIQGFLAAKQIAVVPKPFDVDDLLSAVKKSIELSAK